MLPKDIRKIAKCPRILGHPWNPLASLIPRPPPTPFNPQRGKGGPLWRGSGNETILLPAMEGFKEVEETLSTLDVLPLPPQTAVRVQRMQRAFLDVPSHPALHAVQRVIIALLSLQLRECVRQ